MGGGDAGVGEWREGLREPEASPEKKGREPRFSGKFNHGRRMDRCAEFLGGVSEAVPDPLGIAMLARSAGSQKGA